MQNVFIKKADIETLDLLQAIAKETFYETFSAENSAENMQSYLEEKFSIQQLNLELNNPYSSFYIAYFHDLTIGYLKINEADAQTEKQVGASLEIERIYVLKAFQGQKIGQLLYEKALEIAKEKQVEYVWLGVWEENKRAIQFYQKHGFEIFDHHIFVLGEDQQTDLLMKKTL